MLCTAAACSWALWPSCMYNIHYTSQLSSELRWWWGGGGGGLVWSFTSDSIHYTSQLSSQLGWWWGGGGLVWSFTSDSRVFCTHTNWITSTRCRHVDITRHLWPQCSTLALTKTIKLLSFSTLHTHIWIICYIVDVCYSCIRILLFLDLNAPIAIQNSIWGIRHLL